jgi:hypothetical protein
MDQAGDFESGEGLGETVEVVDPGGVLEAEAVLTEQGGLEGEALGVEGFVGPVHVSQRHAEGDPTQGMIRVQVRQVFEDDSRLGELAEFVPGDAEVQQEIVGVRGSGRGEFEQLDAFADLAALAPGNGGVHRLEVGRNPPDGKRFPGDLDHPVHPEGSELVTNSSDSSPPISHR